MSDDLEERIREGLHDAALPRSPDALREFVVSLRDQPVPARRRRRPRPWIVLVPVAAALIGVIALAGGSRTPPPPSPVPSASTAIATASPSATASPGRLASPSFPATVDGLKAQTVSELLASRAAGEAKGGPYALRGYWTYRGFMHMCAPPPPGYQPGELEYRCVDGEWGITERDEEILNVNLETSVSTPASGPKLTPGWGPVEAMKQLIMPLDKSLRWPPVPIVVVGHFDDPRAADCEPKARKLCRDRFVLERIVMFDPDSMPAPTSSPSPTPFPIADPPPALFTDRQCYNGVPKSFAGWIPFSDLHIQVDGPGYVYAMVTLDVIVIGDWFDVGAYPGHKTRWWGRGVCYALNNTSMGFGSVMGTTFLEVDDGRHIEGAAP